MMSPMLLALLLGGVPARAHSPHDVAMVLDFAPTDGALLTDDSDLLAISTDGGFSFAYRYWFDREPGCVIALSASEWVVGGKSVGPWTTDDGGLTWQAAAGGPDEVASCARDGDTLYVAGSGGAWRSTDGGRNWEELGDLGRDLRRVAPAGDVVLAVAEDGGVLAWDGATWSELAPAGWGALAVARDLDTGRIFVGRENHRVWASDDGGASWFALEESPIGTRVLGAVDGALLAATAEEAVWVSRDGGETWTLEDEGLDDLALGNGGPHDGIHYFHLREHDGLWYLASFEGLYWKEPDEERWHQGNLDVIPRVRSVAWAEGGDLLAAQYGGGIVRGTPGGTDWHPVSDDVGWPYPKHVEVAGDGTALFTISGNAAWYSLDGGETWHAFEVPVHERGDMVRVAPGWPDDPRVLVLGRTEDNEAALAFSADGGETWSQALLPGDCTAKPRAIAWSGDGAMWVSCGRQGYLFRSDDGVDWTIHAELGQEINFLADGDPVLVAADGGIWAATDAGAELVALEGEDVLSVDRGPDGRVWAGVGGEGVVVLDPSDWSARSVGFPVGDYVEWIDVADDGRVAMGTRTGAYWSADGGETWDLACAYDRVEDRLHMWWWEGFEEEDVDWAMTNRARVGEAGARATLDVDGVQVRLLGAAEPGTRIAVAVDGEEPEEIEFSLGAEPGTLWGADLDEGPHEVVVEVLAGTLVLDGGERWRRDPPPLSTGGDDTGAVDTGGSGGGAAGRGGCGCASGGAAGGLLAVLAALAGAVTRRRCGA